MCFISQAKQNLIWRKTSLNREKILDQPSIGNRILELSLWMVLIVVDADNNRPIVRHLLLLRPND
nr:MAG: hypothetical protein EDM05_10435 [Leptolyngbya sp. IPPAS B-1204]